jgi:RHS repeat-associated protein
LTYAGKDRRFSAVSGFATAISYHPNLQINQVTSANGVVTTYGLDPNSMARPASIATTAGWSTGAYAYDGAGNVTRIGNGRFLYDGVSRLLQGVTVTTPADSTTTRTQTVAYDLYGNIQSITTNGSTLNTPTNSANRLTSSGTAYDAAGNLITWNWGNTYQYDPFGLLWHYTSGAEDWLYMYTADDQRVWAYRTGGSGNYWAIRDLDGKVLREYSTHAGWTVDRDYVYRGDKLLAAVTPQGTRHFHLDHLGSVRQVTNASAAQVAFHAYYPFGREATTLGQDNKEQMQFTGHERDLQNTTAGTNSDADDLDYMHARYYNMHVGRFTSVDPARSWDPKAPQSWNRYGYARSNPLALVDPDGRLSVRAYGSGTFRIDFETSPFMIRFEHYYEEIPKRLFPKRLRSFRNPVDGMLALDNLLGPAIETHSLLEEKLNHAAFEKNVQEGFLGAERGAEFREAGLFTRERLEARLQGAVLAEANRLRNRGEIDLGTFQRLIATYDVKRLLDRADEARERALEVLRRFPK